MATLRIAALGLALGALLAVAATAVSAQPAGQATEAEMIFWNRVKESQNPAEIRAYLDAFPNGTFAGIARTRLQSLAPPPPKNSPPPPPKTTEPRQPPSGGGPSGSDPGTKSSVLTETAIIREVQEKLYNLNYDLAVNGRIGDDTRKAIREWQTKAKRPVTGDIDAPQLQVLRDTRVPTVWGALAYVARGASAAVWNRASRREAESAAIAECDKNGGSSCRVVAAANTACGALGFYSGTVEGTTHWGAYASVQPTLAQASDNALVDCRRQAKTPQACVVRLTFCADGSHKQ